MFNLGLAVSLGAVLVAFEWKANEQVVVQDFSGMEDDWDILDVPITNQTPPPPPAPIEVIIKPDDIIIDKIDLQTIDINTTETSVIPVVEITSLLWSKLQM
ncbi:hypothetical protein [Algoriphagus aquimarinus]|uniref:hypothetical protein n=1 Tax=Algoriphagus aquimarinus TaxID=237018 RepID=UPI0030D7EB45